MTDTETGDVTLTNEDQTRIRQAMFRMPYAASPSVYTPSGGGVTPDMIVKYLEDLAGVLRTHADDYTALEKAHLQLTGDVAAFRRIIGTADPS
jgi:hypothetical protein